LQPALFESGGKYTPWERISEGITKLATSENERNFNLAVAAALYDFGVKQQVLSYDKPIAPWSVGYGQSVAYWWNLYTIIERQPSFIFVDPRLAARLTRDARKFVLSIMNERIRVPDPDFAEARLLVAQFGKQDDGKRFVRLYEASDSDLFSFDELNDMIDETYRLWIQVLAERADDARRRPTGSTPLGF